MNKTAQDKLRQGIAIALKELPVLKLFNDQSGIYLWERFNEEDKYCWYIGKAKNLLRRTAQHIMGRKSHLDLSIKAHGLTNAKPNKWNLTILRTCKVADLDRFEKSYIEQWQKEYPDSIMYNIESGGTTGKTIIGEKKQRRDVKWKAEAKNKVLSDYREYFDLKPKENAYNKNTKELKSKPKQLHDEFYV